MSEKYLPLFRKYRPQSFKDVVGQESLVKALSNAIELNRIANAYLFAGPRGTGKTSCARIFAKSLNCINGPTLEPCQKCPSCLDITNASGLDVIEIDAATNRGIDNAKDLIAQTQYAPMNGKYKIFIIDEVHMLSNEAFNALLKTFEEPPQNVIFILATTEPHKVIETIVSRCQRFDLRRITTDDITRRLREISDLEGIKITDDALYAIAKNVSGGLRDSLALLDQVSILGAREEITKEDIENLLGKVTFDVAYDFLNKIISNDTQGALLKLDEVYNKGLEPKNFCENLIEFLRNLIFALTSKNEADILKFTNFNKCDIEKINSANFDKARVFGVLDKVIEYYKEVRFSTNPYLWTELLVIDICKGEIKEPVAVKQVEPAQTVIKPVQVEKSVAKEAPKVPEAPKEVEIPSVPTELPKTETLKTETPKAELPKTEEVEAEPKMPDVPDTLPAEAEAPSVEAATISGVDPKEVWARVLNGIESVPAKFFYSGVGKLVSAENNKIVLGFVNENAINQAKSESKYKHFAKALKENLGEGWTADFILITDDVKVMDVKLNAKIQAPPKPNYVKELPKEEYVQETAQPVRNEPPMPNVPSDNDWQDETESKAADISNYGRKTKEMLETFNGRVIE